ncbi:MAG TPA: AIPR family protein [Bacteroidales bacterium]|nr:AIPR family protein [Bacteroidales bacterium]HPS16343.1 AIPR family protein [Bacteroidales bacterium]
MSILHINQISSKIQDLFKSHLELSDIGAKDNQKDDKIITRCLAAYAIYNSLEISEQQAAQSVVDGGDDNGIDAIFYSPTNKKMIIVQSKWSKDGSGEPESAGVAKFCTGVRDLFNLKFDRFNEKIKRRQNEIELALGEYDTKYELIFIDTCTSLNLAIHSNRHIEDLLNEMNNIGDSNAENLVSFYRLNQSKVHSSLAQSAGNAAIDIELGLTNWGAVNDPFKAYYGMVSGNEIVQWWKNYNVRLFEKNIRQVLGSTDVNEEIEKTLQTRPELFWYFNNGITIISDSISKSLVGGGTRDLGSFKLTNIAIVNGAQTVSTIGKYGVANSSTNLDNVKVGIRIIQLSETPENFDKEITKCNNRQNRIENRDFVSQDIEQIRIKTELMIDGIDYNIMRSESFQYSDKSFELIEATASLACASGKTSLAVQAKGGIGKFFEDLNKGIYKEIFNASVSGYYVFNAVKTVRKIEAIIRKEITLLGTYSGRQYGLLVHGNRMIALKTINELNLKSQLQKIDYKIDDSILEAKVKDIISRMTYYIDTKYTDSILGTLFKNSSKCSDLIDNT